MRWYRLLLWSVSFTNHTNMQASFSQNAESKENGDDADGQLHQQEQHQRSQNAINQELNAAHNQTKHSKNQVSELRLNAHKHITACKICTFFSSSKCCLHHKYKRFHVTSVSSGFLFILFYFPAAVQHNTIQNTVQSAKWTANYNSN